VKAFAALFCGVLFGVGLALSGMTDTTKVLGFLDIFGSWVPDLLFVMGGAVCVTLVAFRFVLRRQRPLLVDSFSLPANKFVDARLLGGAAIFGLGWGIYGYCPGPALSALIYLDADTMIFVGAMFAGMAAVNILEAR